MTLLLAHLVLGLLGLLVVGFVAFPYRGRGIPRTGALSERVSAMADRVDPGEAPPHGVLRARCRTASSGPSARCAGWSPSAGAEHGSKAGYRREFPGPSGYHESSCGRRTSMRCRVE